MFSKWNTRRGPARGRHASRRRLWLTTAALLTACRGGSSAPETAPVTWSSVSAGVFHSCGVGEGRAFCWGVNDDGRLGAGPGVNLGPFFVPVPVAASTPIASVTAGGTHTCALGPSGDAHCWGSTRGGQLGIGEDPSPENCRGRPCASSPRVVLPSGVRAIGAGTEHVCALGSDGVVSCWGSNDVGQLGTGQVGDSSALPVAVSADGRSFSALAVGSYHVCALDDGGEVVCWGANEAGQVGSAVQETCTLDEVTWGCNPTPTPLGTSESFTDLAAGGAHTCGRRADGVLRCWGANSSGQLGVPQSQTSAQCGLETSERPCSAEPVEVSGGLVFASVSAGSAHTCGIDAGGQAYCWGTNSFGQLGGCRLHASFSAPDPVCGGHTFAQLSAGDLHTCAVDVNGEAFCWGVNSSGTLGSTSSTAFGPVPVAAPLVAG